MLYYLPNARSPEQRQEMIALEAAGICIFCPKHYDYGCQGEREILLEYDGGISYKKRILEANGYWTILRNEYPYPGNLHHLLLVPHVHVTRIDELTSYGLRNGYWEILEAAIALCGMNDYYVMGIRNGDMRYTGGTIAHLHVQFVVSNPQHTGDPPILYMGSRPDPDPLSD